MGGLYNAVFGYNPGCLLLAPMLTDQNPEEFFPRFRDCFLGDGGETIVIFTRVGGGNRSEGPDDEYSYGEEKLYDMPTFIRTWDDDFDDTYGYYEFGVPDEWKEDFEHIVPQVKPKVKGYVCKICGHFEPCEGELPADYTCPLCKHPASDFEPIA